jgi:hypothetical protein
VNRGSGIPLLGDEATEAPRYGLKYNQPATDHSAYTTTKAISANISIGIFY